MPYRGSESGPNALFCLFVGIILLIAAGVHGIQVLRFAMNGSQSEGRITDCYSSGTRHLSQTCHYDFQVAGKNYSGSTAGSTLSEGNEVTVDYLSNDPENNSLGRPSWFPYGLFLLVLGGGFLGVGVRQFLNNDDLLTD